MKQTKCKHGCGRYILPGRTANHFVYEHLRKDLVAVRVEDIDDLRREANLSKEILQNNNR